MSKFVVVAIGILIAMMTACTKSDSSLKAALDELIRLNSYTETGITYAQYQDRLLAAKTNIDVALQNTSDDTGKEKIERALNFYLMARDSWQEMIKDGFQHSYPPMKSYWSSGVTAIREATKYISANSFERREITARDKADYEESLRRTRAAEKVAETPKPKPVAPAPTPARYRYFLAQEVKIKRVTARLQFLCTPK